MGPKGLIPNEKPLCRRHFIKHKELAECEERERNEHQILNVYVHVYNKVTI